MSELTIIRADGMPKRIRKRPGRRYLRLPKRLDRSSGEPLFVATRVSNLARISTQLRPYWDQVEGWLIEQDTTSDVMLACLRDAKLNQSPRVIIAADPDVTRRILQAWSDGTQDSIIADAEVVGDRLFVRLASTRLLQIPFEAVRPLRRLDSEERTDFEIDRDGYYLYWPAGDLHLDAEALEININSELRERLDRERLIHDQRHGAAVKQVREAHALRQTDIPGLSDRQLRRIEQGDHPASLKSLLLLAEAHGLGFNDYTEEVAEAMQRVPKPD